MRDVTVVRDEEHNAWQLRIDDRSSGYPRMHYIGVDFIAAGEYRTLAASYADIRDVVRAMRQGPDRRSAPWPGPVTRNRWTRPAR